MQERRRYMRLDVSVRVRWRRISEAANTSFGSEGMTKNISAGGICLAFYETVEKGEMLALEIELPTGKVVRTTGRIAWTRAFDILGIENEKQYDVGIEFLNISDEDRDDIGKFVFSFFQNLDL